MQLFAHGKNHALDGNRELHTVLHAQVQKTVPNLTKFLKKIRVSESRISERTVGAGPPWPPLDSFTQGAATEGRPYKFIPELSWERL